MIGSIALFGWPVVATIFFYRYSLAAAICITVVAGYLFLPIAPNFDLPLLPTLDKESIPAFSALVLALAGVGATAHGRMSGSKIPSNSFKLPLIPRGKLILALLATIMLCGVITAYLNDDPLRYGPRVVRGLTLYDGFASSMKAGVMILPLLLGYAFLSGPQEHRTILIVLAIFGAIYSLLALYEIRMSPQLNRTVYGFFPHSWAQHKRGGGWRPIVFLQHGLYLGIYLAMATFAAVSVLKAATAELRTKVMWLAIVTGGTLLLSSNLGATLILFILMPVLLFMSERLQLLIAAAIAALVLLYPMARGAGIVPTEAVVSFAEKIDESRADSLEFRLLNEDVLLEKATQRPWFGWGGWTRGRIFDEKGNITSITDGHWITIFGDGGWFRYISEMGLLCLPVILLAFRRKEDDLGPFTVGIVLVLVVNLIDLIPNAGLSPITWMISGALWGRLARGTIEDEKAQADNDGSLEPRSAYTRQTGKIDRHVRAKPRATL
ncbi:hypothetical protein L0666_16880 [Octadecabacter sp. CECT 8868]|uniref:hypothetical protein n=1 Tax=Octadecabacter algicola TaxID=2909342 RepID=UPI001F3C3903|nr:hypothetical protein [Octadecabacter algicola]MCF2906671.1 hypothetical protein [Octadecabacter algicola]